MTKAPALFIGHGSPMNAIEATPWARAWAELAARFPRPRAIVVVSAHWTTEGVRITSNAVPPTIHDFGQSFPPALFAVQYPAPGDPALAAELAQRLAAFNAKLDDSWGLDHGTWSVLVHIYPDADIPIVQVSLDARRSPAEHYQIGQALAALRADNILVLASGNIVHNLRAYYTLRGAPPPPTDDAFEAFIVSAVRAHNHAAIIDYASRPEAALAAPDWDHFTPVIYGLAAGGDEQPEIFNRTGPAPGLFMTSFAYGLPQ